jgi:hypothetical protein
MSVTQVEPLIERLNDLGSDVRHRSQVECTAVSHLSAAFAVCQTLDVATSSVATCSSSNSSQVVSLHH